MFRIGVNGIRSMITLLAFSAIFGLTTAESFGQRKDNPEKKKREITLTQNAGIVCRIRGLETVIHLIGACTK